MIFIPGPSQYNFFPARRATLPNRIVSVIGPSNSKFAPPAGPPLHASIHSWLLPADLGSVFGRLLEFLCFRLGYQARILSMKSAYYSSSLTNKQQTFVFSTHLSPFFHLERTRRPQPAIVPGHPDRRHITSRRELKMNHGGGRKCFLKSFGRATFNALRWPQLQDTKDGVKAVAAHIT